MILYTAILNLILIIKKKTEKVLCSSSEYYIRDGIFIVQLFFSVTMKVARTKPGKIIIKIDNSMLD